MNIINYSEEQLDDIIKRSEEDINNIISTVNDILIDIKENKDHAILSYTEKFDGVKLDTMLVSDEEINQGSVDDGNFGQDEAGRQNCSNYWWCGTAGAEACRSCDRRGRHGGSAGYQPASD